MSISIPEEAPEMAPLKLITMTVKLNINACLNLDVISRYVKLDDQIVGISYRDNIIRGVCASKKGQEEKVEYYTSDSISGKFKNQCTFIVDIGEKRINTKVFNNGKLVNVGCKHPDHALKVAQILVNAFKSVQGTVIYTIPSVITSANVKKFFKDDLRKKFGILIQTLANDLELSCNLEPFSTSVSADEAYQMFQEEIQFEEYIHDIMYIYTIINILKAYYDEQGLQDMVPYDTDEFKYLLTVITDYTDHELNHIKYDFPSYLNHHNIISIDYESISIALINKSTNCGYFINRTVLKDILPLETDVIKCVYDKNRYPGVITHYQTPTKEVKIIVFNTGKINITATRTHEQVNQAYEFISNFCKEKFNELLLTNEYHNKIKEYEDKLPIQYDVGLIEGQQYYLLKKSSITSNPRNIRFLKIKGLLCEYREK
jgi:TATA-box binding protein (TBP) (component of TFIID and TFIIIB)